VKLNKPIKMAIAGDEEIRKVMNKNRIYENSKNLDEESPNLLNNNIKNWYKHYAAMNIGRNNKFSDSRSLSPEPDNDRTVLHSSAQRKHIRKIGSIHTYVPPKEYIVENQPVKLDLNKSQVKEPTVKIEKKIPDFSKPSISAKNKPTKFEPKKENQTYYKRPTQNEKLDFKALRKPKVPLNMEYHELYEIRRQQHEDIFSMLEMDGNKSSNLLNKNRIDESETTSTSGIKTNIKKQDKVITEKRKMSSEEPNSEVEKIWGQMKFRFEAKSAKELQAEKKDKIQIFYKKDQNWYFAENANGSQGIIPISYVDILPLEGTLEPTIIHGSAEAKYDFKGQTKTQLSFQKGNLIELIKKVDQNWYTGKLNNNIGIVAKNYINIIKDVEVIPPKPAKFPQVPMYKKPTNLKPSNQATKQNITNDLSKLSVSSSDDTIVNEKIARAADLANKVVTNTPKLNSIQTTKAPVKYEFDVDELENMVQGISESETIVDPNDVIGVYEVKYDYTACNDDELNLRRGNKIEVVEICDDGWYVGTCLATGKFGTFPGNFVVVAEPS